MGEKVRTIKLGFVNAFLVESRNGFILIDTGMANQWDQLESRLLSFGCLPEQLKLVVITHGDPDHTGGCVKLQQKYKVSVAIHQGDASMVENGIMQKRKIRGLKRKVFIFFRRLMMPKLRMTKFKPDMLLSDGQSLEQYGLKARVYHLPGHTMGSIGILTDEGDFFSGDTLVNNKKPDTATYIENSQELQNTIDKLKKLGMKKIFPGHGKPFLAEELPWMKK